MYDYNSEIRYEVENDIAQKKMLVVKEKVKELHIIRKEIAERGRNIFEAQAKYYNKKHLKKDYNVKNLIMLFVKNLKQKRFNKKFSDKFLNFFKMLKSVDKQTYRLILSATYKIHFVFHVFYLKFYRRKKDQKNVFFLFLSEFIDDQQEGKMKEILNRKSKKNEIFYKIKGIEHFEKYDQGVFENYLKNVSELKHEFDQKSKFKRIARDRFAKRRKKIGNKKQKKVSFQTIN